MTSEIWELSGTNLVELYRSRDLSPVEVVQHILDRIDQVDQHLNAFVTVTSDLALRQARAAESAYSDGSAGCLAGIPVSIKILLLSKESG